MNWFTINHDGGTAYVSLGSDIGSFGVGAEEFKAQLGSPRKIELVISSNGGDADCGLRLFHLLEPFDVEVLIAGPCWSSAVTVAMAGKVIRIYRGERIMVHSPASHVFGNPAQLRAAARNLQPTRRKVRDVIAARTGQPPSVVNKWLSAADTWFDADEALKVGLVNEVVERPPLPRVDKLKPRNGAFPKPPTEQEKLFRRFLTAFDTVTVRNRSEFGRTLQDWFNAKVKEDV